jgi:hypothetical protein
MMPQHDRGARHRVHAPQGIAAPTGAGARTPGCARAALVRSGLAALAAAACAGGCSFDLTDIRGESTSAVFQIQLDLFNCHGPLAVRATFSPGRGEDGKIREVVSDEFALGDRTIPPEAVHQLGVREYAIADDIAALAPGNVLRVQPPAVEGQRPTIDVDVYRVVATDSIIAARAGQIEVQLLGGSGNDMGISVVGPVIVSTSVDWAAAVLPDSSTRPLLSFEGAGFPGSAISLSADLLPPGFVRGRLRVSGNSRHVLSDVSETYIVRIGRSFACEIPLRIE